MSKLKQWQSESLEVGKRVRYQVPDRKIIRTEEPSTCMGEFSEDMVNKDGTVLLEIVTVPHITLTTFINGYKDDVREVEYTIFFRGKMVRKGFGDGPIHLLRAENIIGFPSDPTY